MNLIPARLKSFRLVAWKKWVPNFAFKLKRGSKAAVMVDKKGTPQIFMFDAFAFLDLLSRVDDALVDRLTTEEYHDRSINPAGWLIDKIESRLPLNPRFVLSLRKAVAEAKKRGWIPLAKIERKLGFR